MNRFLRFLLILLIVSVLGFFLYLYAKMFAGLAGPQGW